MRCQFHTCRPVQRGLARIAATVLSVHAVPVWCGFRFGSAADGQGIPASFRARVIRAVLCPATRWANIHLTTGAVAGSGVAALLREAEPVRDSLLQAAQAPVSDKVLLVVKQSARLL